MTILDVARSAGVSAATVSRVLNDSARVAPQKARTVRRAAAALGFRPNFVGRNLRAARTRDIGVVLPTLSHPVFAECLQGLELAARAHGHAVLFATTGYEPAQEDRAVELLLQHRVDGMVLTVANAGRSRVLDKLEHEQMPFVLVYNQIARTARHAGRPTVSVDNRAAARQMVEHLIALGHGRIAMLAGRFVQSDRARLRHRGYVDAMSAAGLAAPEPMQLAFMVDDARAALHELMQRRGRPTALFCSSDQLAMVAMRDLQRLGWRVPADVSVAGFDGVQLGTLLAPALTTVAQPSAQIAATAVDLLIKMIAGQRLEAPVLLPHTLLQGGSAAAAPELETTPGIASHAVSALAVPARALSST